MSKDCRVHIDVPGSDLFVQNSPGEAPTAAPRAAKAMVIAKKRVIFLSALQVPRNRAGGGSDGARRDKGRFVVVFSDERS